MVTLDRTEPLSLLSPWDNVDFKLAASRDRQRSDLNAYKNDLQQARETSKIAIETLQRMIKSSEDLFGGYEKGFVAQHTNQARVVQELKPDMTRKVSDLLKHKEELLKANEKVRSLEKTIHELNVKNEELESDVYELKEMRQGVLKVFGILEESQDTTLGMSKTSNPTVSAGFNHMAKRSTPQRNETCHTPSVIAVDPDGDMYEPPSRPTRRRNTSTVGDGLGLTHTSIAASSNSSEFLRATLLGIWELLCNVRRSPDCQRYGNGLSCIDQIKDNIDQNRYEEVQDLVAEFLACEEKCEWSNARLFVVTVDEDYHAALSGPSTPPATPECSHMETRSAARKRQSEQGSDGGVCAKRSRNSEG